MTIEAKPQEVLPPVDLPGIGDLNPPDPSVGGSVLANGQLVEITNNYAETFNTAPPVEDYSRPTNAYLSKGTTDYLAGTYYLGSTKYYQLGSGIRIYAKDARLGGSADFTANTASVNDVTVGATHTTMQFGFSWRVPYNVQLLPQSYRDTSSSHQPQLCNHRADHRVCRNHFLLHYRCQRHAGCIGQPAVQQSGVGKGRQ